MRRRAGVAVVAGLVAGVAGLAGCSDDAGSDGGGGDAAGAAGRAVVLMERLRCELGSYEVAPDAAWDAVDARECWRGPFIGRVYGSLTDGQARAAVRSLTEDGPPRGTGSSCQETDGGARDLFLVQGDGWVAVIAGEDDADTAAERLGGTRRNEPLPPAPDADEVAGCVPDRSGALGDTGEVEVAGDPVDAPAAFEPSTSAVLAARVGCDRGTFRRSAGADWQSADVHGCSSDPDLEIYASLTTPQREAARRLLAMHADVVAPPGSGCPSGAGYHRYLVAGDTWVAVVLDEDAARAVAEELDGQLQPGTLHTNVGSSNVTSCYSEP